MELAELLGGVVVGSTRDLSATFYNPGALALARNPSLLASVQSFEAVRLEAASQPPVIDFSDLSVRPSPSLFAFAVPRSRTGGHTLAISSLVRQDFDLRVDNWQVTTAQTAGGEALFDQSLNENWFGLSWAHQVGDRLPGELLLQARGRVRWLGRSCQPRQHDHGHRVPLEHVWLHGMCALPRPEGGAVGRTV